APGRLHHRAGERPHRAARDPRRVDPAGRALPAGGRAATGGRQRTAHSGAVRGRGGMKPPAGVTRDLLVLTRREREEEEEAQFKPLEWGLIRRLWTYTRPHRRKRNLLVLF